MPLDMTNWNEPERKEPSLEGLIEWLEGQEPGTTYNYYCCGGGCLFGLWIGAEFPELAWEVVHNGVGWADRVLSHAASPQPWTFEAAAKRARALLRETVAVG